MATPSYPPPPAGGVDQYFPFNVPPNPDPHVFEIGIVLGGTVSAGTYTAGVLDFLFEALDEWNKAKADASNATVPRHKVLIRVVTGTSGGGINAANAARALNYSFPPAPITSAEAQRARNPFYNLWVNSIDITGLLALDDLQDSTIKSLLCGTALDKAAAVSLGFTGGPPPDRDYLVNPLPVFLTYTNIAGIPYKQQFTGPTGRSEYFIDHADFVRYSVPLDGQKNSPVYGNAPPDAMVVGNGGLNWGGLTNYALGTGAFPLGMPARDFSRPAEHYRYRYATWTDEASNARTDWMQPDWGYLLQPGQPGSTPYRLVALDGGCADNEPIELARTWLAGLHGKNPRSGREAMRAVVLVDPFADRPAQIDLSQLTLMKLIGPTISTLVESNRYETADISLFMNDNVYSRYLVSPVRSNGNGGSWTGGDAIAGSRLFAFMGFMSKRFREHDYMLGRRNCQQFLRAWFTLPEGNPLFSVPKPVPGKPGGELPIIPLCGSAAVAQDEPGWPKGAFAPDSISDPLQARIKRILEIVEHGIFPGGLFGNLLSSVVNSLVAKALASRVIKKINDELGPLA